jgi:hypothetical protein
VACILSLSFEIEFMDFEKLFNIGFSPIIGNSVFVFSVFLVASLAVQTHTKSLIPETRLDQN